MVVARAGTEHHVEAPVLLPHLGITHMIGAIGGIVGIAQDGHLLAKGESVARDGKGLVCLAPRVVVVVVTGLEHVARVVAPKCPVAHHSGTRVRTSLVVLAAGHDGATQPAPREQILAHPMSPAVTELGPAGHVLVKDVIRAVELAEAIGVGDVATRRLKMVA